MHPLDNAIDEVDDDGKHPSLSWHSVGWLDLGWEGPRSGEDNDDEDDIEDWSDDAKHDMEDDDIISAYFFDCFTLLTSAPWHSPLTTVMLQVTGLLISWLSHFPPSHFNKNVFIIINC